MANINSRKKRTRKIKKRKLSKKQFKEIFQHWRPTGVQNNEENGKEKEIKNTHTKIYHHKINETRIN